MVHKRRGVVMIITLLAVLLLAAMVVYVLNLGLQANARIVTQNSADSAAVAGAGWVARSLNTVAMNNVATTRMIAMVNVLDSMPMALDFTVKDQTAVATALENQLSRGVYQPWLRQELQQVQTEVDAELDQLQPLSDFFNNSSFDVRDLTFYNGPNGRGQIWRAMQSLDEFSQATMENLGVLAQLNANRGGLVNIESDSTGSADAAALLVPVVPDVPWRRGRFEDYQRPVINGLLPSGVDDRQYNRGPYDALYGWRSWSYQNSPPGTVVDPGSSQVIGANNPVSIGLGAASQGVRVQREPTGYHVYGPLAWTLERLHGYTIASLRHSRFDDWMRILSWRTISHLWPQQISWASRPIYDPQWVTDYSRARSIAAQGSGRIRNTAFVAVEIRSRYPYGHASFLSPGSWAYAMVNRERSPRTVFAQGWQDPEGWSATRTDSYIWRSEWEYQAYFDIAIGLTSQYDQQGHAVPQTVYRVDHFMFVGVNVGDPVQDRNPYAGFDPAAEDAPAPIDLDHGRVTRDDTSRLEHLTYLGVARRNDRALLWPAQFEGNKPYPHMVAIAQAEVFNNHSWDLWTQMWHAQLTRVQDYERWVSRLHDSADDAGMTPVLSEQDVTELEQYLASLEPLAPVMLKH